MNKLVALVAGTRPEVIKLAPLMRALTDATVIAYFLLVEQQPDLLVGHARDEDIGRRRYGRRVALVTLPTGGLTLTRNLTAVVSAVDRWMAKHQPAAVVVQGDTTTALAGALAAFYRQVPVVHLEAGLRSGSLDDPYPEEGNRRLIAQVSALHLAPTPRSEAALRAEQVPGRIVTVGNTVVDGLRAMARADPRDLRSLRGDVVVCRRTLLQFVRGRDLVVVTCHRREGWQGYLPALARAVAELPPDRYAVVWPLHPNPLVHKTVRPACSGRDHVLLTAPLCRRDFVRLVADASAIVTDSGGVTEEAIVLGRPTIVVRAATERPEALESGIGYQLSRDALEAGRLGEILEQARSWIAEPGTEAAFGDGRAGERSASEIVRLLRQLAGDAAASGDEDVHAPRTE